MTDEAQDYLCVGVCMADPDSGYCLGCGRPPLGEATVVAEAAPPPRDTLPPAGRDPDTPA